MKCPQIYAWATNKMPSKMQFFKGKSYFCMIFMSKTRWLEKKTCCRHFAFAHVVQVRTFCRKRSRAADARIVALSCS